MRRFIGLLVTLLSCALPCAATLHGAGFELPGGSVGSTDWSTSWDRFLSGWQAFGSWRFLVAQVVELLLAAALAMLIAAHPRNYKRGLVANLEMIEQPKTLTLYAVVAVVVAEIVQVYPAMAFVVFGIGGLMRFRTNLGVPKLTGRASSGAAGGAGGGVRSSSLRARPCDESSRRATDLWGKINTARSRIRANTGERELRDDRPLPDLRWRDVPVLGQGSLVLPVQGHSPPVDRP